MVPVLGRVASVMRQVARGMDSPQSCSKVWTHLRRVGEVFGGESG